MMNYSLGLCMAALIATPALGQTPMAVAGNAPATDRCEAMPIGGTGGAPGRHGELTIAGTEARRDVRLDGRAVQRLGRDVASASIRAACHGSVVDYYVLGLAITGAAPACAVRYQVAEVVGRGRIRLSPRFGSCADGATATLTGSRLIVTMPAGPGDTNNIAYAYTAGRIVAEAQAPAPVVMAAAPVRRSGRHTPVAMAAWAPPRACAVIAGGTPLRAAGPAADILLAQFERGWPRDWRQRSRLRNQSFTSTGLRAVVTDLACLAALPGGERIVARAARPLFESRRHGTLAFEQLDEVARGAAVDPGVRAAARTFHAQMRYEVDMPRLE